MENWSSNKYEVIHYSYRCVQTAFLDLLRGGQVFREREKTDGQSEKESEAGEKS